LALDIAGFIFSSNTVASLQKAQKPAAHCRSPVGSVITHALAFLLALRGIVVEHENPTSTGTPTALLLTQKQAQPASTAVVVLVSFPSGFAG